MCVNPVKRHGYSFIYLYNVVCNTVLYYKIAEAMCIVNNNVNGKHIIQYMIKLKSDNHK